MYIKLKQSNEKSLSFDCERDCWSCWNFIFL